MKTLFTLFFSFLFLFGYSQELELDFAHRYGIIQDGLRHSVEFLEYFEEYNTWVVAGRFQSQVRVGISSTESLTSEDDTELGFVAMYNDNWELLNSFKTGGEVLHADLTETDIIISGSFIGIADFDFNSDENELYESQSSFGNGYVASYSLSGEFNWVNPFYCEGVSNKGTLCFIHNGIVHLILDYNGSQFGDSLFFSQEDLNLEFTSDAGNSVILFQFGLDGTHTNHHHFYSEDTSVFMRNSLLSLDKIYLSFNVTGGQFDAGINENMSFTNEYVSNVLVCAYDLATLDLVEFYSFDAQNQLSGARGNLMSFGQSNNLLFVGKMTGSIALRDHLNPDYQLIEFDEIEGEIAIFEYNTTTGFVQLNSFASEGGLGVGAILSLQNNDLILSISFSENLFFNNTLLEQTNENQSSNSLVYVNQAFNGARVFTYSTGSDQIGRGFLASSSLGNILVGGSYEGDHDMDFSEENTQFLGDVDDDLAGYIAKYMFDPINLVTETRNNRINIYPNPSKHSININYNQHQKTKLDYKIFDSSGKIVLSGELLNQRINISRLQSGMYSLLILDQAIKLLID